MRTTGISFCVCIFPYFHINLHWRNSSLVLGSGKEIIWMQFTMKISKRYTLVWHHAFYSNCIVFLNIECILKFTTQQTICLTLIILNKPMHLPMFTTFKWPYQHVTSCKHAWILTQFVSAHKYLYWCSGRLFIVQDL